MAQIVLDSANLRKAMRHLARVDPDFARAIKEVGHPELRVVPSGFGGLMRSIVGQQVSVHAARSIWLRLESAAPSMEPAEFLKLTDAELRAVGLSNAKMKYGRSLAADIVEGRIDFAALDERRRCAHARRGDCRIEPRDAEPLVAERIALAGVGRVGRMEHHVGHQRRQHRRQPDQVVAIGAVTVQQHHEVAGRAAVVRPVGRTRELGHSFLLQSGMLRR